MSKESTSRLAICYESAGHTRNDFPTEAELQRLVTSAHYEHIEIALVPRTRTTQTPGVQIIEVPDAFADEVIRILESHELKEYRMKVSKVTPASVGTSRFR